ncbi:D-glycero-alpha-D-manno-heptose 7-phosphate kinase (EC [Olavius algarvensis associated proteobacterium Delta 3]|nr:D-glycero-alpha-D-manno-heptose 7-phosphate kinase (EC [Olavius algarvensis associated proteobacterium Delta 3]
MIIVKTPLRIGFVGGGSDLKKFYDRCDGMVVSTAIDKYVYAIIKERFDEMIYINYSRKECVDKVAAIQHDLVREAMKITGVTQGVEITTLADIPSSGSGLGSSSSITVALLHALYAFQNTLVTAEQLAVEACRIEIDILGKPIGRQDQYAAAFGGINKFIFSKGDLTLRVPVEMGNAQKRKFASSLLLYYTGITRSADTILNRQTSNLAETDKFEGMRRMVHLVDPFIENMRDGNISGCGVLMEENWNLKQTMASGISNPQIHDMYERATSAGALAGKVAGAGGGGFLLLMVPRERQNAVFEALKDYRELPFMLEESGSKVIFDDRSYPSK